jgi:hypothetical protein
MAHTPVNHPLRPVYRALGALTGLYLVIFGVVGLITTGGNGLFAVDNGSALGQGTNLAWSLVAIVLGAAVLGASVLGRNIDVAVNTYVGWTLLVVGTAMLCLLRTEINIFNFSVATVIVTYLLGLVLIQAGMYSKVVPQEQAGTPRPVQEGRRTQESNA